MPYAPTVNDISGQILAQGKINAAQAKAQGILGQAQALYQGKVQAAQSLAAGISSAGSSIAGGIASGLDSLNRTYTQNKLITDNVYGKLDSYQQLGLMAPQVADHIAGLKDPQKMAAAMAVYDQFIQNTMQDASAINRYRAQQQIQQQLDQTGQRIDQYDPVTKQPVTMFRTSPNQAQILQPKAPEHQIIGAESGFYDYQPGSGQPAQPVQGGGQNLKPRQPPTNMFMDPNFQPGAGPGGAPAATPASTPRAAAMGGYQVGGKYKMPNGQVLTYLGGDPSNPQSWQ